MKRIALLVLFLLAISVQANAREGKSPKLKIGKHTAKVVKGKEAKPVATISKITVDEILANPRLALNRRWEVTGFTFSVLPNKGEYWGPFTVSGAELSQVIKNGLKDHAGKSGQIFLEEVKVADRSDKPGSLNTVVVKYTN